MRRALLLVPFVFACSKAETPQADSAAMATPPPARLTAADVAGTWYGVTMAETSDSVIGRWTLTSTEQGGGLVREGMKDTVQFLNSFDADSVTATSLAYVDRTSPRTMLMFRSVGRLKDGKLSGTVTVVLAQKPDSVVSRSRWEATRTPQ